VVEDPDGREEADGREEETENETDLRTELGLKTEVALLNSRLDRGASLCRYPRISEHFVAVELMMTAS
jgi:hypothetical protein